MSNRRIYSTDGNEIFKFENKKILQKSKLVVDEWKHETFCTTISITNLGWKLDVD